MSFLRMQESRVFREIFILDFWFLDFFIYSSFATLDHPLSHTGCEDFALLIDLHEDGECEFWIPRMEATEVIRETLRKHRDDLPWGIDTRCALDSLMVESTSLTYVLSNIGDMHDEEKFPILIPCDTDSIIEVLRICTIDRHREHVTEIRTECGMDIFPHVPRMRVY